MVDQLHIRHGIDVLVSDLIDNHTTKAGSMALAPITQ